jgi:hypothetical protein
MAIESQGAILYFSTSTSLSTAISVGSVVGFNGPSGSAGEIDVTNLGSTAKEFLMGLRDEGSITFDCLFDPNDSGQVKMRESRAGRTKSHWAIKLSSPTTKVWQMDGDGYVTGYAISGKVDDKVSLSAAIRITGAVNLATVAAP